MIRPNHILYKCRHKKAHANVFSHLYLIRSSNIIIKNQLFKEKLNTREDGVNKAIRESTWADLTIVNDELKAVPEFDVKSLKYRDLQIVCSQLKIKGVKNSMKEQKQVSLHQIKAKYDKIADMSDLHQQERSHSALIVC